MDLVTPGYSYLEYPEHLEFLEDLEHPGSLFPGYLVNLECLVVLATLGYSYLEYPEHLEFLEDLVLLVFLENLLFPAIRVDLDRQQ